ncbi:calcium-binding protein [Roseicyclus marinus]|uniref:calcium-binding protein n=1 Tax=Roseicyclus marinus TaxID=2161673 RepID=UPI00240F9FFA|nr:calcium-binding protein [Roseicyclus marinus]MDG3041565.1 calcium-binding protein [Roseicyclus marinus]
MPNLVLEGSSLSTLNRLDHGIRDLMVRETAGGPVLYAMSGPTGGLAAYGLGPGGGLSLLDFTYFPADLASGVLGGMAILDLPGGPHVVVAEDPQDRSLAAYALASSGTIEAQVTIGGISASNGAVLSLDQSGGSMLFLGNEGQASIRGYSVATGLQLSAQFAFGATQAAYASSVFALETVTTGSADFLLGASLTGRGVSAYRIGAEGLVTTGNLGVEEGIGIMTPTTLATADIGGRHFVLLGSAPPDGIGQSGAITVMELRTNGSLVPVDHVLDTQETRFGMIQSLDVVTSNGVTYVVAAGGDDGLSLFVLLPTGRLVLLDQMTAGSAAGLEAVSALTAMADAAGLRVFVASEVRAGVTELSVATQDNGIVASAAAGGATLTGGALDDILIGGAGDDSLAGANGADILEDGAGRDTLSGGGGRDIYVLRADGQVDTIVSFERGNDRLDLSDWPFFYDPAGLSIQSTAVGALVTWRNETLVIETMNRRTLSEQDVRAAVLTGPQRRPMLAEADPDSDLYLVGTAGPDVLEGMGGRDTLFGEGGEDVLLGGAGEDALHGGVGDDTLDGGAQNDSLFGGDGADLLRGDAGFDRLDGGTGNDTLEGGPGNDQMFGGSGNDHLDGGDRNDRLVGGSGNDTLVGGAGGDILEGQSGNDSLLGGLGNDRFWGSNGHDTLHGDEGDDRLFGGADRDVLYGGVGDDALDGGTQNDRLFGGDGADLLRGRAGFDMLDGGAGNDRLEGSAGNDQLFGGTGDDYLDGGDRHDRLEGGGGNDTLVGGRGTDALIGGADHDVFVFAPGHGKDRIEDFDATDPFERIDLSEITAATGFSDYSSFAATGAIRSVADGVLIATGGGNSILLLGVQLADLDDSDFVF